MLYFAYGSNLDPEQMKERCPAHRVVGLAALRDHRLVFPRYSERWGGGASSVQGSRGRTVWGVLYDLAEGELAVLDEREGFRSTGSQHNAYDRVTIPVDLVRPDDGSVPRRVLAWIYVAHPARPTPPSRRYLDTILRGARHHRLPDEYVAELSGVATAEATET